MISLKNYPYAIVVLLALGINLALTGYSQAQNEPLGIFLTWKEDPTSSISIDWHLESEAKQTLHYRKKGEETWKGADCEMTDFPHTPRTIHRVFLNGLEPGTSYEIKFGEDQKVYYFNTMPADIAKEPIRIAIGGDSMHEQEWMENINRQVARFDPHFAVIGGDLAYANGDPKNIDRWYRWFDAVKNTLIKEDGKIIPILVGIGNHEVQGGTFSKHEDFAFDDESRERIAPFYYSLFSWPNQPGYGVLDFGDYLSFFLLDSDHTNPIDGEQLEWFRREIAVRDDKSHIITLYHVPAYPSVRDFNGTTQTRVRELWLPIIEKAGGKLVFENHDHAYKRTYPIKNNEIHQDGIVFIGDGSWGTKPRDIHDPTSTWYLDNAQSIRAFTLVTIHGPAYHIISVDEEGNIIDSYPENPLIDNK